MNARTLKESDLLLRLEKDGVYYQSSLIPLENINYVSNGLEVFIPPNERLKISMDTSMFEQVNAWMVKEYFKRIFVYQMNQWDLKLSDGKFE